VLLAISRSYSYYPTLFLFYDHIALPCRLRRGCTHDGGPAHKRVRLGQFWITSVCGEGLDLLMTKRILLAHSHLPSQTQRQQDPLLSSILPTDDSASDLTTQVQFPPSCLAFRLHLCRRADG
jgi:hypothetical protein